MPVVVAVVEDASASRLLAAPGRSGGSSSASGRSRRLSPPDPQQQVGQAQARVHGGAPGASSSTSPLHVQIGGDDPVAAATRSERSRQTSGRGTGTPTTISSGGSKSDPSPASAILDTSRGTTSGSTGLFDITTATPSPGDLDLPDHCWAVPATARPCRPVLPTAQGPLAGRRPDPPEEPSPGKVRLHEVRGSFYNNMADTDQQHPDEVTLRWRRGGRRRICAAGDILKSTLEAYFDPGAAPAGPESVRPVHAEQSELDGYLREVFDQLDYHRCGTVSREDFETLCEVVDIQVTPRGSSSGHPLGMSYYRHSGLEWLSSYMPRPNSPASPLRLDRLGEVRYKKTTDCPDGGFRNNGSGSKGGVRGIASACVGGPADPAAKGTNGRLVQGPSPHPPNFLFTFGPRPFWELWPHRRKLRKRLNLDEFKRALLEQWAKASGRSPSRVSEVFSPVSPEISGTAGRAEKVFMSAAAGIPPEIAREHLVRQQERLPLGPAVVYSNNGEGNNGMNAVGVGRKLSSIEQDYSETKARRLIRSLVRATKRYQMIGKLSRGLGSAKGAGTPEGTLNGATTLCSGKKTKTPKAARKSKAATRLAKLRMSLRASIRRSRRRGTLLKRSRNLTISAPLQVQRSPLQQRRHLGDPVTRNPAPPSSDGLSHGDGISAGSGNDPIYAVVCKVKPGGEASSEEASGRSTASQLKRVAMLEKQVQRQQKELSTMKELVEDLRSSLQLSDAQNLALQVLLRKMSKAETSLVTNAKAAAAAAAAATASGRGPTPETPAGHGRDLQPRPDFPDGCQRRLMMAQGDGVGKAIAAASTSTMTSLAAVPGPEAGLDRFRSQMDESEKQLENLVRELKEMSQTMYPQPNLRHHHANGCRDNNTTATTSSSGSTFNGGGFGYQDFDPLQDEIRKTSRVLSLTKEELKAAQQELETTAGRLHLQQQESDMTSDGGPCCLKEAHKALERAQRQITTLR